MPERDRHGIRICTEFGNPPVPWRGQDWHACRDGYGEEDGPYGQGKTEREAIENLYENLMDMGDPPFPFNLSELELIAAIERSGYELRIGLSGKPESFRR